MDSGFTYFRGYQNYIRIAHNGDFYIEPNALLSNAVSAIDELNQRIANLENETRLLRNQMYDQLGIQISNE
jgi:hypothetical protein